MQRSSRRHWLTEAAFGLLPYVAVVTAILAWIGVAGPWTPVAVLFGLMLRFGLRNAHHHGVFAPWPAEYRALRKILRRDEPARRERIANTVITAINTATFEHDRPASSDDDRGQALDPADEALVRSGTAIAVAHGLLPGKIRFEEICELAPEGEVSAHALRRFRGLEIQVDPEAR